MSDLNIFMKKPKWPDLLEALSEILGMPGLDESDETGRRRVWHLLGLDLIAIEDPKLEDDHNLPFSTFTSEVDLVLHNTDHPKEAETFRDALAILLVLRLRSQVDPDTRLVRNLQKEIAV